MTEVFHIVPATSRAPVIAIAVLFIGVLLAVMAALGATMRGSRSATFELNTEALRLRGDLYGRMIPRAQLRGDQARVVNLARERDLAPRLRVGGTAMPGYRAGWFKLRNGERALLYLTTIDRVVYIPTTEGYSLLLSVDRPDDLVARLRPEAQQ